MAEHRLSMGHARAIWVCRLKICKKIVAQRAAAEGLSVRQVERLIQSVTSKREATAPAEQPRNPPTTRTSPRQLANWKPHSVHACESSPRIGDRGRIEIEYFSQRRSGSNLQSDRRDEKLEDVVPAAGVEPATYGL